ncbi:unnamed protein product [Porites lobata]|uniref:GAIN-B domain-containing protein n=1 Tax=Porites lobata TaxID=104759 RepID=A0ABN8N1A3_9CNID|nr:unnamed protein product [Porites lobata]
MGYTKNDSLPVEELKKIGSDDTVPYNFSMYTSKCMFYDEKKNVWSTDGLKVGHKTNLKSTECLTTHLGTFGSGFSFLSAFNYTVAR